MASILYPVGYELTKNLDPDRLRPEELLAAALSADRMTFVTIHTEYNLLTNRVWTPADLGLVSAGRLRLTDLTLRNYFFRRNLKLAILADQPQPANAEGLHHADVLSSMIEAPTYFLHQNIFQICMGYVLYPWLLYRYCPPNYLSWGFLFDYLEDQSTVPDRMYQVKLKGFLFPTQSEDTTASPTLLARRYCTCWLVAYMLATATAPRGHRGTPNLLDQPLHFHTDAYLNAWVIDPESGEYNGYERGLASIDRETFQFAMVKDPDLQRAWNNETRILRAPPFMVASFPTGGTFRTMRNFLESDTEFSFALSQWNSANPPVVTTREGFRRDFIVPLDPASDTTGPVVQYRQITPLPTARLSMYPNRSQPEPVYGEYLASSCWFGTRFTEGRPKAAVHGISLEGPRIILRDTQDILHLTEYELFSAANRTSTYQYPIRKIDRRLFQDAQAQDTTEAIHQEAVAHALARTHMNYDTIPWDQLRTNGADQHTLACLHAYLYHRADVQRANLPVPLQRALQLVHDATGVAAWAYLGPEVWEMSFFCKSLRQSYRRAEVNLLDRVLAPEYFVTAFPLNLLEYHDQNPVINFYPVTSKELQETTRLIPWSWNQITFGWTRREHMLTPWKRLVGLANHPHLLWLYHPFEDTPWVKKGRYTTGLGLTTGPSTKPNQPLTRVPLAIRPYLLKLVRALVCKGKKYFDKLYRDRILPAESSIEEEVMAAYYRYYEMPSEEDEELPAEIVDVPLETSLLDTMCARIAVAYTLPTKRRVAGDTDSQETMIVEYQGQPDAADDFTKEFFLAYQDTDNTQAVLGTEAVGPVQLDDGWATSNDLLAQLRTDRELLTMSPGLIFNDVSSPGVMDKEAPYEEIPSETPIRHIEESPSGTAGVTTTVLMDELAEAVIRQLFPDRSEAPPVAGPSTREGSESPFALEGLDWGVPSDTLTEATAPQVEEDSGPFTPLDIPALDSAISSPQPEEAARGTAPVQEQPVFDLLDKVVTYDLARVFNQPETGTVRAIFTTLGPPAAFDVYRIARNIHDTRLFQPIPKDIELVPINIFDPLTVVWTRKIEDHIPTNRTAHGVQADVLGVPGARVNGDMRFEGIRKQGLVLTCALSIGSLYLFLGERRLYHTPDGDMYTYSFVTSVPSTFVTTSMHSTLQRFKECLPVSGLHSTYRKDWDNFEWKVYVPRLHLPLDTTDGQVELTFTASLHNDAWFLGLRTLLESYTSPSHFKRAATLYSRNRLVNVY